MSLHTMENRTVEGLFVRLTEMERINLRRASPDRIRFLAYTTYLRETGGSPEQLTQVQELCMKKFDDYDAIDPFSVEGAGFIPHTWQF